LTVFREVRAVSSVLLSTLNFSVFSSTEIFLDSVLLNSAAIFLDSSGLFWMMMKVLVLRVVVVSVLLQHVELLELVPGNQLVNFLLGSFEGGEGSASGYLSLGSLSLYLHTELLSCGPPRCT
jgi:hypothetical protein